MNDSVLFDPDLLLRYDKAGPRYTSYPTAAQFRSDFGAADYHALAADPSARDRPLSLYLHIPFCDTVCYYCACSKVVTKDRSRAAPYLARLQQEMALQAELFAGRRVDQLHWGGGTPTFLSWTEMLALMAALRKHYGLRNDDQGEYAIEIDPRRAGTETIAVLRDLGFNRLSLGVQDLEPQVQEAVNRVQSATQTFSLMDAARSRGFRSVHVDLIYGLPLQTVESFARTLTAVIAASPDRLSIFNYAHLPARFPPQRRIRAEDLPSPAEKLRILERSIAQLTDAGYVYIGMDHFAKPDDELALAQRTGSLYRNFQGYSTHADCDLVGLGVSAISKIGDGYAQNAKSLESYYTALDHGSLPLERGMVLTLDDRLRRDVITDLICHFRLDIRAIEARYAIDFGVYFEEEVDALEVMAGDGLLTQTSAAIEVQPLGKLLIRNICMIFDRYLREEKAEFRYSKVI